jgi:hypothetical protein
MIESMAASVLNKGTRLRTELLWELKQLILKHNNGSGNSMRVEQAEEIFRSMIYGIVLYLKKNPVPAEILCEISGAELYRRAGEFMQSEIRRAKTLYRKAVETRIPTDLPVYCELLREDIPAFFQLYDTKFAAHETPTLMVYPLLHEPANPGGIEYVTAYLKELIAENEICRRYSPNYIRAALLLYGRKYRMNYHELVVNLPEVLAEAEKGI